jgi:hypothetical protein
MNETQNDTVRLMMQPGVIICPVFCVVIGLYLQCVRKLACDWPLPAICEEAGLCSVLWLVLTCGVWESCRWHVLIHRSRGWGRWGPPSWRTSRKRGYRWASLPSACGQPAGTHRHCDAWRTSHWCDLGCHSQAQGICREEREWQRERGVTLVYL